MTVLLRQLTFKFGKLLFPSSAFYYHFLQNAKPDVRMARQESELSITMQVVKFTFFFISFLFLLFCFVELETKAIYQGHGKPSLTINVAFNPIQSDVFLI